MKFLTEEKVKKLRRVALEDLGLSGSDLFYSSFYRLRSAGCSEDFDESETTGYFPYSEFIAGEENTDIKYGLGITGELDVEDNIIVVCRI